jgi:hypothetical protein
VLFSNARIAHIVNNGFEPVWQSVRPVPIVTIDFGNGQKIKRTLHGNIATYVCTSSGHVLDVLPGLYTSDVYETRLLALMNEARLAPKSKPEYVKWLASQQAKRKQAGDNKKNGAERKRRDMTKSIVLELPMIWTLGTPAKVNQPPKDVVESLKSSGQLDIWKAMIEDTRINDTDRRKQINEFLAKSGPVFPKSMTTWLYREVLDADIDDPWLGLKDLADASVFSSVEVSSSDAVGTSNQ